MVGFFHGFACLVAYFALVATIALLAHRFMRIPTEVFRKILHMILLGSLPVFLAAFPSWQAAACAAVVFAVVVYPILCLAERWKGFGALLVQRKTGEIKRSLMLVFFMFALVIAVCWGALGERLLAAASIFAWGPGDALAALVGKKYGRHKIRGRFLSGKKSLEGCAAMFAAALFCVLALLAVRGGLTAPALVIVSLATALAAALAELYTPDGNDTVVCPLTAMIVMLALLRLFGGIA